MEMVVLTINYRGVFFPATFYRFETPVSVYTPRANLHHETIEGRTPRASLHETR